RALRRVLGVGVLAPLRVLVLEEGVVLDRRLPRGVQDLARLARLLDEGPRLPGVLPLRLVGLDAVLGLVAERRGLELDVALGEAPHQLRPIRGVLRRRREEALEALDLRDEELAGARREAVAPLVALRRVHRGRRVVRLRLLIALLQVDAL